MMLGAILIGCSTGGDADEGQPITLAVINARLWTGTAGSPWAEAIAVSGDRIVAVGSTGDVQKLVGDSTRVIDASGLRLSSVQLRDARTPAEFIGRIKEFAATVPPGTWITGGDWDHTLWGGELPRADWIDSVTPDHPVWLHRLDGHMALANSAAMRAAGVTRATEDVDGGTVVRDASGNPAGVFKDNAMDAISAVVAPISPELEDRALDSAMKYVAAQGVTSVHNMGTWEELAVFERARKAGRLITRINAAVPLSTWERLRDTVKARGNGDEWVHIGGLKGFVDGSLGSTAGNGTRHWRSGHPAAARHL